MKQIIIAAAITALIVLSGTAIAFKTGVIGAQGTQYQDFAYEAGVQTQTAPGRGGCGSKGGGCGSGGCAVSGGKGGCRGGALGAGQGVDLEPIRQAAADYYINKYGDTAITAEAKDFGCHQEAYILKDGFTIMKLSVNGNRVYEAN